MEQRIERVDNIPLIVHWLKKMKIHEIIDSVFIPHGNWKGLSYGKLAVVFLTYIMHSLCHRLSGVEPWVNEHKAVLETVTGWTINDKDATDDRIGIMIEAFGDDEKCREFQLKHGQNTIQAFEMPTEFARYDTTSFNVYHKPGDSDKGILKLGHSKDRRPDLLQFKQGLGTLDPAGFPLYTETIDGNKADDNCYVPAWRRIAETVGHKDFLYVTDCKGGALGIRAAISKEGGTFLVPLAMTGEVPELLKNYVLNPPAAFDKIVLEPRTADAMKEGAEKRVAGEGFAVKREMVATLPDGKVHKWTEQQMISKSYAHAKRKIKGFEKRQAKAEGCLKKMRAKKDESVSDFQKRAERILKKYKVRDFIVLEVRESIKRKRKYIGSGRPGPDRRYKMIKIRKVTLSFKHNDNATDQFKTIAGWRIFVTNALPERMSLNQSSEYYRDEYLVERGFHRLKKGNLPALPLFLRIDERIKGLMLILTIALQALTLLEFVIRRELADNLETLAGLVPGNPKMKTHRPTAERLLPQFKNLHMIVEDTETQTEGYLFEKLNSLQLKILSLLNIPEEIYDLSFSRLKFQDSS